MEMFCKRPFHLWEKEKRIVLPAIELLNFHSSKMDAKPAFDISPQNYPSVLLPWKDKQNKHEKELLHFCGSSFLICYSFTNLLTPGLPALHQRSPGQRANGFLFNCIISYISESKNPNQRSYLIKIFVTNTWAFTI